MKTTDLMMKLMVAIRPNETITRKEFLRLVNDIFPPEITHTKNRIEVGGVTYIRDQACAAMAAQVHEDHGVNIQYDTVKDDFVVSEDKESALNLLEATTDALGSLLEAVRAKGIKVSNESDNHMKPGKWNLTMPNNLPLQTLLMACARAGVKTHAMGGIVGVGTTQWDVRYPGQQALKRERARHSALHRALGVLGYDLRSNQDKDGNWSWSISPPAGSFNLAFQNDVVVVPDEVLIRGHRYFSEEGLISTFKACSASQLHIDLVVGGLNPNAPGEYNSWEKRVWTRGFNEGKQERAAEFTTLVNFKSYVHGRLDDAGVAKNPDGPHSKEGCRIGDRLDIVLAFAKQPPVPPLNVELQRQVDRMRDAMVAKEAQDARMFGALDKVGVAVHGDMGDGEWKVKLPIMFTPLDNGIRVNIQRHWSEKGSHFDVKPSDPGYDLIYRLYSDTLPRPAKA